MDNVIEFPKRELGDDELTPLPMTLEEAKSNVEGIRHIYLNDVTEAIVSTMVHQAMGAGFDVMDDERRKDFGFLIEAVRSILCSATGLYHPFQDVSDKIMEEHDDSGILMIADSINVKFNDESDDNDEPEASTEGV